MCDRLRTKIWSLQDQECRGAAPNPRGSLCTPCTVHPASRSALLVSLSVCLSVSLSVCASVCAYLSLCLLLFEYRSVSINSGTPAWLMMFSDVLLSIVTKCIMTEGKRTKTTPNKTFQTKNAGQNSPNKNPRELNQTPCKDIYSMYVRM